MRFQYSVSSAAIILAASGIASAQAQTATITPSNANVLNLLAPFLSLNASAIGQATLQGNLSQAIAINNQSTPDQRALAISGKALPGGTPFLGSITLVDGSVVKLGPADNLAGGLPLQAIQSNPGMPGTINPIQPVGGYGPVLGPLYQQGIRASTDTTGPLARTFDFLNRAYKFTSSDLGVAKNYFANGAANNPSVTPAGYVPVPAVAPAGYTLPRFNGLPNTTTSVLDIAAGVTNTQDGQDVYGSSRPVQVRPKGIDPFDPTSINGLTTNPSFPSGHTNYGITDSILLGMLTPSLYQSMLMRGSEYGDSRIVLGVHYPLDIIGSRAFSAYNLAQAFTNPAYIDNAATTGTAINLTSLFTQAQGELQSYLSAGCGAAVATCATSAANTGGNPYLPSAANQALYQSRLTYGLPVLTFAEAPREAAPAGGPDAAILLAPLYGGSSSAAAQIAPKGGLYGALQDSTINQIIVNTETNALSAFYGMPLSYWARIDLYSAAGYFRNVVGTLSMAASDRVATDVTIGQTGALYANGTIAGTVTVGTGGLLGGTGTMGGLVAQSGAVVAPGNSIGTLNVAGNAAFAAGTTLRVEANAAGQADRLAVTGTATLSGGTVQVLAADGAYDPRTRYTVLTAGGGVQGQFSGVTANFAFLTPTLGYGANAVDLTLTRNDVAFSTIAQTRNQGSVADAIQAAGAGAALYGRTVGLSTPEARAAFGALTGDIHASAAGAQFETAFFVREAILDRLRWGAGEATDYGALPATYTADLPGRAAPVVPVPMRVLDPQVFGLWGQGFGSFGQVRGDGNAASLARQTSGFVLGADLRLETGFRLGFTGGYTLTSLDSAGRLATGTIESGFGGVYGGFARGAFALRLGAVYADQASRLRRAVTFAGVSDSDTARIGGSTVQGFGEIGYRIVLGAAPALALQASALQPTYLEPFVGGAYVSIGRDRFAETGGLAALTGAAQTTEVATSTVGVRGQTSLDLGLGSGAPVSLHGLMGYRRAYGDVVPKALLGFGTGPSFLVAGTPIGRDALVAEAGLDVRVDRATTLGVAYTGQVGERAQDHAVKGSFTYRF
ncbi:autotransporter [Methylobacterium sp. Leaf88]|nr:autotransporter [Methylobacterium sp. Leaf88]